MKSSVDLTHNGVFHAKDWASGDCGTTTAVVYGTSNMIGKLTNKHWLLSVEKLFRLLVLNLCRQLVGI